ncbi:DCC1-like thiol-disulfide oxidoreductase family protein [Aquisphaera insulae]|uniref:DCC1-like thiol-disulfide oxidoreductase family protein n=1 Tax=Aquisphaera insulae TaxID=2712864 RepID=UPI002030856A|nr:DCC1-like thiol-disulfide oxidoreductase family protein [Aquisphaera insulae]
MSEPLAYLRELVRSVRQGWDAFFFRPADPTPLGLVRIVTASLALWSLFVLGLDLHDHFGSSGWADPALIRQNQLERQPWAWSFWFLVPDSLLRPAWLGCLAVFGLLAAGLFSRIAAVVGWIIYVSTVRRVPIALFGFDQVISTLLFYLMITGASGQALSLDRFLRRWRDARGVAASRAFVAGVGRLVSPRIPAVPVPTVSAGLALRLIQLHLAFIYLMAGLAKLQGPSWWNGTALWGTMMAGEFVTRDFSGLAEWPLLINFLTHASIAFEILYPALIWVGILRPLFLAGAVALHLGIGYVAPGLAEFGLAMIGANLAFASGPWLRSLVAGRSGSQPALRVLFDGQCPRCRATMAALTAADPDHVLEPIDLNAVEPASVHPSLTKAACMASMHAVAASGKVYGGFDAMRAIGGRLPLAWPLAVAAWIPGVAWIGRRVYNRIAGARTRDVPCTDAACSLPGQGPASTSPDRDRDPREPPRPAPIPAQEMQPQ